MKPTNTLVCETAHLDEEPDGHSDVVCICRRHSERGKRLVEVIIDQAHSTIGHFGQFHNLTLHMEGTTGGV